MSRPTKPEAERRTSKIEVRVTPAEKTQIIANARDNSRDVSEFLRDLGMGGNSGRVSLVAPKRPKPGIDRELHLRQLAELGKIGSNLNQVAKVLNTREGFGEPLGTAPVAVERVTLALEAALKDLRRILANGH